MEKYCLRFVFNNIVLYFVCVKNVFYIFVDLSLNFEFDL